MLEIKNLSKQFGGHKANQNINLSLQTNKIHALIGPNGAGKSTLIAQICGELEPDQGQILFKQQDITLLKPEQRNLLGLGHLFQTTALFNELSVLDNMRIPLLQSVKPTSSLPQKAWQWFWPSLAEDKVVRSTAMGLLERLGLEHNPNQIVATLSHGEQRQLEMAMTLATSPSCLLLDEPMAGMSSEESARMIKLIQKLRAEHTILLVEHDMKAVFDLADTISVLVDGNIIASGTADEIRNNPAVQNAYLGDDAC